MSVELGPMALASTSRARNVLGISSIGRTPISSAVGQNRIGAEAYQRHSVWYIKTRPDHTQKDNLLNLPQCQTVNRLIMSSGD
jgi:hypothetical protein